MTKTGTMEWADLFDLFPATQGDLAKRLGISRQAMHQMRGLKHNTAPAIRIAALTKAWQSVNKADAPTYQQILVAWTVAKSRSLRRRKNN